MKLGLIIKITSGGEQEFFAINKESEWAKFATDSRSIINNLKGFDGSGKSSIIVKLLGNLGYLLGVVKARPEGSGRPNDNTTAWIHVPANMQINGSELCSVISRVDEQLSAALGINPAIFEELFSKEYSEKDVQFSALAFVKNSPDGCIGWCSYGKGADYQLYELLGDSIAQIHYKKYKCICFVDNAFGFSFDVGEKIKQDVTQAIKINAPIDNMGFKPFLKNVGQDIAFNKNIEIPAHSQIRVIWKKEGYSDIEKEVIAGNPFNLTIQENERKLVFKRSWIRIINKRFEPISNAEVIVNGKAFSTDTMLIPEAAIREGIKIRVNCKGYEHNEKVINDISQNIEIKLDDEQFSKEYKLLVEDGRNLDSDARIIVKMNNHYTGMPLKGYRSENGYIVYENNLVLKIKWFFLGIVSVFVIGFLWAGFVALDDWIDNHEFQLGWPPISKIEKTIKPMQTPTHTSSSDSANQEEQSNTEESSMKEKMCNYLSKNNVWHKDSLAQYDLTETLFEDMNSFNLNNLIELEKTELKEIEHIKKIVNASRLSIEKKIPLNGKYNSDTDPEITIDRFINRITTNVPTTSTNKPRTSGNITGTKDSNQGKKGSKNNRDITE